MWVSFSSLSLCLSGPLSLLPSFEATDFHHSNGIIIENTHWWSIYRLSIEKTVFHRNCWFMWIAEKRLNLGIGAVTEGLMTPLAHFHENNSRANEYKPNDTRKSIIARKSSGKQWFYSVHSNLKKTIIIGGIVCIGYGCGRFCSLY